MDYDRHDVTQIELRVGPSVAITVDITVATSAPLDVLHPIYM